MIWFLGMLVVLVFGKTWLKGCREGFVSLKSATRLKRTGVHKTGEIIGFEECVDKEGDKWFYPIIAFSYQGRQWQFTSQVGYDDKGLAGAYVRVIHDPLTPNLAEVDSLMALFGGPVLTLFFQILFLVLAAGYAIQEFLA
jgi:hypothetical protein